MNLLNPMNPLNPKLTSGVRHHWNELLDALVLLDFAREDVALRVHHDRIDPMELAGIGAVPAEAADRLAAGAIEDPYLVVGAVSHIEKFLLRVARDRQLVGGPAQREVLAVETAAVLRALRGRIRRHVELLQELAVGREHLDAVLSALADVDLAVLRDLDEMQIGDEVLLFRRRTAGPLVLRQRIVGDFAE